MTYRIQVRLVIAGALVILALLFAYKGYMVTVAISSQPDCVANETLTGTPAQRVC